MYFLFVQIGRDRPCYVIYKSIGGGSFKKKEANNSDNIDDKNNNNNVCTDEAIKNDTSCKTHKLRNDNCKILTNNCKGNAKSRKIVKNAVL